MTVKIGTSIDLLND